MKNASGEREREDSKEPRRHSALQRRGPKEKQRKSLTSVETRGSTSTQTRRGWSGCRQNTNAGSFRESGGSGGPTRIISYHRLPDVMKGQLRKRLVVAPSLQFPVYGFVRGRCRCGVRGQRETICPTNRKWFPDLEGT